MLCAVLTPCGVSEVCPVRAIFFEYYQGCRRFLKCWHPKDALKG